MGEPHLAEVRSASQAAGERLRHEVIDGVVFWSARRRRRPRGASPRRCICCRATTSTSWATARRRACLPAGSPWPPATAGSATSVVLLDGRLAGFWRRTSARTRCSWRSRFASRSTPPRCRAGGGGGPVRRVPRPLARRCGWSTTRPGARRGGTAVSGGGSRVGRSAAAPDVRRSPLVCLAVAAAAPPAPPGPPASRRRPAATRPSRGPSHSGARRRGAGRGRRRGSSRTTRRAAGTSGSSSGWRPARRCS